MCIRDSSSIFDSKTLTSILSLYSAILKNPTSKRNSFPTIISNPITSKDTRTSAHQSIRSIFASKLETTTNATDDTITISAGGPPPKPRGGNVSTSGTGNGNGGRGGKGRISWQDLGGDYLHFTLYKENKDTMEAVYFLASQLKSGIKSFQFGGTKDRRGVTVQRCSAYRVHAEAVAGLNKQLRGSRVGDFEYCKYGLELGDLGGNEFVITSVSYTHLTLPTKRIV